MKGFKSFDDMLEVMSSAKRPSKTVQWPVPDGAESFKVVLWCLSDIEHAEAQRAAQEWVFDSEQGLGASALAVELQREIFDSEHERQILVRALRRADDPSLPLCMDIDALRRVLNADTRLALMRLYNGWADECSPIRELEGLTPADLRAKLRDFRDAGALSEWLDSCGFGTLKRFVQLLADQ